MKTLKLVAAIAALTGSMSANAANIDLFTVPTGEVELVVDDSTTNAFVENGGGTTTIMGGYRDMELNFISKTDIATTSAGASFLTKAFKACQMVSPEGGQPGIW